MTLYGILDGCHHLRGTRYCCLSGSEGQNAVMLCRPGDNECACLVAVFEESAPSWLTVKSVHLQPWFLLSLSLVFTSLFLCRIPLVAIHSSEALILIYQAAWCHVPEEHNAALYISQAPGHLVRTYCCMWMLGVTF